MNAFLARAGVASRRRADELIKAGRVTVNGEPGQLNTVVGARDRVEVDGEEVARQRLPYVLLHKPAGVVTTARDPQGRPTVVELVPAEPRVVPVGRLDVDTTGALLLTNEHLPCCRSTGTSWRALLQPGGGRQAGRVAAFGMSGGLFSHAPGAREGQPFPRHEHDPEQRHRHERNRVQHDRGADRAIGSAREERRHRELVGGVKAADRARRRRRHADDEQRHHEERTRVAGT